MLISSLIYISTITILAFLAYSVWRKHSTSLAHRTFALLLLVTATWLVPLFLADITQDASQALFFIRFSRLFDPLIAYLFLIFCSLFPVKNSAWRKITVAAVVPALFFELYAFSPHYVTAVDTSGYATQPSVVGYVLYLYLIYNLVYFLIAFWLLKRKFSYVTRLQQAQIKLVVLSVVLTIIFNVSLLVFPHGDQYDWVALFGPVSILLAAFMLRYAINYFDLFDIRSLTFRSIIPVAPYLRISGDKTQAFFALHTIAKEADAHNIAFDFSGVKNLDPDIAKGIVGLRHNLKTEFHKQVYFIGCEPNIHELLKT